MPHKMPVGDEARHLVVSLILLIPCRSHAVSSLKNS
jgi:hypothetical protein